jgi:hypothetical protein
MLRSANVIGDRVLDPTKDLADAAEETAPLDTATGSGLFGDI